MALSNDHTGLVARIVSRLGSSDAATFRAGGRAVAVQAVEQRYELVRALRSALSEFAATELSDQRRGYVEALEDLLLTAEAAIEPREQETRARRELLASSRLQRALDLFVESPLTPSELADAIDMSAATGTRCVAQLRDLALVTELPARDGRERPHRITSLGRRLASTNARREAPDLVINEAVAIPAASPIEMDPLTGVLGSRAFERVLEHELELHKQAQRPLALWRIDIADSPEMDFAELDQCVKNVTDTLKRTLAPPACIARYERDKFFALVPSQEKKGALLVAENLCKELTPIGVTIGISGTDENEGSDAEALLRACEAALEEARLIGTVMWREPDDDERLVAVGTIDR